MAVAIRQQVDPSYLLQRGKWQPQGWSIVRSGVIRQIPLDRNGLPTIAATVEAFEWDDIQGWGIGGSDGGVSRLRAAIQQHGSDLYAYNLLRRDVANFLGIRITSYRLVLYHSFAELAGWALLILASVFAAVIFVQYLTTGRAPALTDLQQFFGGLFKAAGDAGGTVTSGLSQPFLFFMLAGGVAAILFAQAEKGAGVKAKGGIKQPSGSIGVKAGPVSTRVGS